jgi:phage tail P2-like protein
MVDFLSVLPPALAADARFRALEQVHAGRLGKIDLSYLVPRLVDTAPAELLPYLAEEFGVASLDVWRLAASDDVKRAVIRRGILLRKLQGTVWAVEESLRLLDVEPTLTEWFDVGGLRGTFSVEADVFGRVVDDGLYAAANGTIARAKNVRSHLVGLQLNSATRGNAPFVAAFSTCAITVSVLPKGVVL